MKSYLALLLLPGFVLAQQSGPVDSIRNQSLEGSEAGAISTSILPGYHFSGTYASPDSSYLHFKHNKIATELEILPDSSGRYSFKDVRTLWKERARPNQLNRLSDGVVYWARLRLVGTPAFHGRQLFSVGHGNVFNWRNIHIYTPDGKGGFSRQETGNDVPVWKKYRRLWMNLFEVDVPQNDTISVYLRLANKSRIYPPLDSSIYLHHIDAATFWQPFAFATFFTGLLYGGLGLQMLYFLLLFFVERDKLHLYFSLFLLGLILVLLNEGRELFQLFSHLAEWRNWMMPWSIILCCVALFLYANVYLNLAELKIRLRKGIPYFLALSAVAALLYSLLYNWSSGNPSLQWYGLLFRSFEIIGLLYLILLGVLAWRKGHRPALFYLLAFASFLIPTLLMTITIILDLNHETFMITYNFYKVSMLLPPIFFALGMGYRTKLLRQQKAAAVAARNMAQAAEAAAKEANEAKSIFLSTVSHELRTPLTSIIGFTKLNRKNLEEKLLPNINPEDAQARKTLQRITKNLKVVESESQRLTNLINELLDLAKIEAGKVEWNMTKIDPAELIERATNATAGLFQEKPGLQLMKEIPDGLPSITADQDRIIQVLINLISNAVKFTEAGTVTVGAGMSPEEAKSEQRAADSELIFFVRDTGSGIPPGHLDQVFEKFKQVEDHQAGKPQGTGLGLPICKEIVEHHGGRIWVESQLGQGSSFYFSLPAISA